MSHYLLRRSGQGLLVLWAAFTLSFVLLQVLPGDAVLIKFQNPDLGLSPEQIAEMRLAYGADSPLWRQYFHTLMAMLRGDFGYSLQAGLPVSALIASNLPETLSGAARLCSGGGAGFRPRLRLTAAGPALAQQRAAIPAGAVYLAADVLARHRPDSDFLLSAALDPGDQSRAD